MPVIFTLLGKLKNFLTEYESVQPKYLADEVFASYFSPFSYETLKAAGAGDTKLTPFESEENIRDYVAKLIEGKELSWLPSYGPEMRGGTCNCSVIVSDDPVGSPIIAHPNILMVMNEPSLDKFEDTVAPGGTIFVDSALIARKVKRTDVEVVYIPATQMAKDMQAVSLANMIILGAIVEKLKCVKYETVIDALKHTISARKANLLDLNLKAVEAGAKFIRG